MYLINFRVHLIKITILSLLLANKITANYDKQIPLNNNTTDFEFINSIDSNQNDSKKSDNLHLLTRIYQRLHDLHNRHHHHHLHHISSAASDNILDRPFRLFDRQTDHNNNDGYNDRFRRPMFNRPMGGGGFNRPNFGNRPWLNRQKRSNDDDGIDNYLDQLNYNKKLKFNSIRNKSDYNNQFDRSSVFKPISTYKSNKLLGQSINLSNRSTFIHNHLKPSFKEYSLKSSSSSDLSPSTLKNNNNNKFYPSTTTPSSNSPYLTTSYINNQNNYNLFNPLYNSIDNSYNIYQYESTHHHYYHQAYLLYKYFKLYKDKSISEINWSILPDEIRDKFKMLILSLRYIQNLNNNNNNNNDPNALSSLSEDYVISKALEIVKWKGWNSQQQKTNKKEFDNSIKPIFPVQYTNRLIDQQSVDHLINQPINIKSPVIKTNVKYDNNYKLPTATTLIANHHLNIIDQIDDIDSINTFSNDKYSNTYTNNYQDSSNLTPAAAATTTTTTTTTRPITTTMSTNEALKKAFENIEDIRTNHSCKEPKGKLFNLKEINPDYRFYLPKCVYLHKCDDQAGCCTGQKHCVASEQKIITKYFYNLSSDKRQSRVVRLEFVNDTKCECRELDTNFHYQQTDLNKNEFGNNNQLKSNTHKSINHYLIKSVDVNKYYNKSNEKLAFSNKSLSHKQIVFGKNDNLDSGIL